MQSFFSYNPTSSSSSSSPSPSPYYITNRDIISPEIPRGTGRITPPAHVSPSPAGGVRQLPTSSPILTAIRSYTFSPITGGGLVSSTPSGDRIIPLDPVYEPNPRGVEGWKEEEVMIEYHLRYQDHVVHPPRAVNCPLPTLGGAKSSS